ncbi:MAG: transaldolase [Acidobacteria bacterium]|nr:transaldolase [Acidobacteriota bacterium]
MNRLQALGQYGQSVWLDYIRRQIIENGELRRMVDEDGVAGVTSNPAIFEKAIAGSTDYTDALARHVAAGVIGPKPLYEALAIADIQDAADILRPVYERTNGRDGFVSLEVSPTLAADTPGTLDEARRLWKAVGRDNLMVKVPATPEGIPAIRQLISDGININVTLLFAVEMYEKVAEAYIAGLDARAAAGGDLSRVASVASFFVSRIDSVIDARLAEKAAASTNADERDRLAKLAGKAAIASARLAYHRYLQAFRTPHWQALAGRGARTQRLLWASTSTKNPAYRDVIYVEELIGADTVNTIPPATLEAFRNHGEVRASLEDSPEDAAAALRRIEAGGISIREVTAHLLADGVTQFAVAFSRLLDAVAAKSAAVPQRAGGR